MFDASNFAAVQGMYQRKRRLVCRDSAVAAIQNDYGVLICSDGAESAKHSAEAAQSVVDFLLPKFLELAPNLLRTSPEPTSADQLVELLIQARRHLESDYPETDFKSLQSTLLACLVGPERLCFVHLGDGFACAVAEDQGTYRFVSSEPENGIDLSTTYSLTDADWFQHLRIKMFDGRFVFAVCMTDGAQALFQDEAGFAIRRLVELAILPNDDPNHIAAFLDTALARLLSDDDKSLCYIRSKAIEDYLNHLIKTQRELLTYPSSKSLDHARLRDDDRGSQRRFAIRFLKYASASSNRSRKPNRLLLWLVGLAVIIIGFTVTVTSVLRTDEPDEVRSIKKLIERSAKQGQTP